MNLQDLRRRVCGLPDKNGATGPTWINPKEAIYLLDTIDFMQSRLESLEKDAARYRWLRNETAIVASNFTERIAIAHYEKDEHDCRALDAHIDTAMQANKGE